MSNSILYHFGKNISDLLLLDSNQQSPVNSLAYVALHFHFVYDNNRDHFNDSTEFEENDDVDDFSQETTEVNEVTEISETLDIPKNSTPSGEVRAHEVILVNPNYHPWVSALMLLDSIFEVNFTTDRDFVNIN